MIDTIEIPALFDAHVHFRQGARLGKYVPQTVRCCDRAVVMPNTDPPILTGSCALEYHKQIMRWVPENVEFTPLMTLYLTPATRHKDITLAVKQAGKVLAGVKLYPQGGTTNSGHGIPVNWLYHPERGAEMVEPMPQDMRDTFKAIAESGLVLCVHGEDPNEPLLQRESSFAWSGFADWYVRAHPGARLVMEHITTDSMLGLVQRLHQDGHKIAGTVTLHHTKHSIDDAYGQVFNTCWPPPNERRHRDQLRGTVRLGGEKCLFLGSDSAPHTIDTKYQPKCTCGCYTAPVLVEMLADLFAEDTWIETAHKRGSLASMRMNMFTNLNGFEFYGDMAKPSGRTLTLVRDEWTVPEFAANDKENGVRIWNAGGKVGFRLKE